jgi:uncharacterized protein
MAQVVVTGKLPQNPVVIEGFPSKGFVSTIAANYMIRELKMELVGYIDSEETCSMAIIRDSKPLRPIRIYAKDNLIMIYSEIMVPLNMVSKISTLVNSWLDEIKPSTVVLMAGITGAETSKGHEIMGVASTPELARALESSKVRLIQDGVLTGVSSNILLHCIDGKIPTVALMVETEYSPDALAAVSMLDILNKLLKVRMNVDSLRHTGREIEEEFKNILHQMRKGREGHVKMEGNCPMYG